MKTRKINALKIYTLLLLVFSLLTMCVSAKDKNWYTQVRSDHERPTAPLGYDEIKDLNAYYLGKDEKKIYLTFDAGYSNEYVERIIDILVDRKIPAAFFVLGHFCEERPDLLKKMNENNILVCNHTYSHKNAEALKDFTTFCDEVQSLEQKSLDKSGVTVAKYFRPPCGNFSKEVIENANKLGYKSVFWSIAYMDWEKDNQPDEAESLKKLTDRLHNGAIILLHPTSKTNANIMENLIDNIQKEGYSFGSLDEL